jgi:tyrosine-protein phosphatase SIW14
MMALISRTRMTGSFRRAWKFCADGIFVSARSRIALAVVFALTSAISVSAGPPQAASDTPSHAEHAIGTHLQDKGIPNFGQVSVNLYRGAQPSSAGFETLKKTGIDVVIDMRGGRSKDEEAAVTKLGMQYVSIPSHCPYPRDQTWAKFLKVIEENPGKKVFVHCRLGNDRTGLAVASYRMAEEGWSAADAMKEMEAFGFTAIHHAMCPGMDAYEEKFPERLRKGEAFRELQVRKGGSQ